MTNTPRLRVGLIEDDPRLRARFGMALGAAVGLQLLFLSGGGTAALALLELHLLDVLLLGLTPGDAAALAVIRDVRRRQPACEVLVLARDAHADLMYAAFAAGAGGYLCHDVADDELPRHLRALRAGGAPLSPPVARWLLQQWQASLSEAARQPPGPPLTRREHDVLRLVAQGFRHTESAARLGLSVTTVRTHLRSVYAKLGVHGQTEAVFEARALGWLD